MAEEKPTTEEKNEDKALGSAGEKALAEEREARKKLEREVAELRSWKADREMTDVRAEVVADKGLTAVMAEALVGTTKDELEAHADKLKALFPKNREAFGRPREALRPGASNEDDEEDLSKERAAKIAAGLDG